MCVCVSVSVCVCVSLSLSLSLSLYVRVCVCGVCVQSSQMAFVKHKNSWGDRDAQRIACLLTLLRRLKQFGVWCFNLSA